jgi:hypothetical protein
MTINDKAVPRRSPAARGYPSAASVPPAVFRCSCGTGVTFITEFEKILEIRSYTETFGYYRGPRFPRKTEFPH